MSPEEVTARAVRAASRMYLADRPQVALDYVAEALEADPHCYEALVMAGELYDRGGPELGLDEREASWMAVSYFDRAIAAQPEHSEAYAEKAIALCALGECQAAISSADAGLSVFDIHLTIDEPPDVRVNIGESLYRAKALALKESGQVAEGRAVLEEGLSRFPGSEYLTQIVDGFLILS
jgi:tetratricopeptide (TPR) repeat protein